MRGYRALLRLYPASFRREFGAEMEAVFAARRREADGFVGVLWCWVVAVADIVGNAAAAHWDILLQDLRYIGRSLRRTPGFAVTAVLVTALGVGANAASFSVTDFVLIRPLPFPEPDRLVRLWERTPGYGQLELAPANYRDWREGAQSFQSIGAYATGSANLVGGQVPERIEVSFVEKSVFEVLGVEPLLGRRFTAEDAGRGVPHTVILSHGLWLNRFGGDPAVLGKVINLDDRQHQVIGVMPPKFEFPSPSITLWIGIGFGESDLESRIDHSYDVVARLKPGVTIERARADLELVTKRVATAHPETNKDSGATIGDLREELSDRNKTLIWSLSGASLCILLIACANLGSLLLARGIARRRELAVRAALGAGRERLVRQLVTESLLIAGAGGALGVLTAVVTVPLLARLIPPGLPLGGAPSVNLRVLAFATVVTVVTCLLFAVVPALRVGGEGDATELRGGSRGGGGRRERLRAILVTVEVAASVVLLVGAGLLMRAIQRIQDVDPGFRSEGVYTVRTALPAPRYAKVVDRERFYREVLTQVKALPGVSEASYVTCLPMVCGGLIWPVGLNGSLESFDLTATASLRYVTPGYFATLGIPLRAGRDVSDQDRQGGANVAVVSESFGQRFWPGENPLGRRFTIAFVEREVVGIVTDIKTRGLEKVSEPQVFLPASQVADSYLSYYWPKDLAVMTSEGAAVLLPAVTRIVRSVDADQPLSNPRMMTEVVAAQTGPRAAQLRILAALAAVALLLAGIGIHGLLSFIVSQRSQEIGVRMALGAGGASVVGLVLGRGMAMALTGIAVGGFGAYLAGRAIQAALFGVPPADPITFAIVIALCLVMTLAGCLAPALRAVRVDPLRAMRAE